jgi:hypothetical protein
MAPLYLVTLLLLKIEVSSGMPLGRNLQGRGSALHFSVLYARAPQPRYTLSRQIQLRHFALQLESTPERSSGFVINSSIMSCSTGQPQVPHRPLLRSSILVSSRMQRSYVELASKHAHPTSIREQLTTTSTREHLILCRNAQRGQPYIGHPHPHSSTHGHA